MRERILSALDVELVVELLVSDDPEDGGGGGGGAIPNLMCPFLYFYLWIFAHEWGDLMEK